MSSGEDMCETSELEPAQRAPFDETIEQPALVTVPHAT